MAKYTGTMYVGGDEYNSTAGGYQIGGNDNATATATITLPTTYTEYDDCTIKCTLYSVTAPSSWKSGWSCYASLLTGAYPNDYQYGGSLDIDRSDFGDSTSASSRTLEIPISRFIEADEEMSWLTGVFEGGQTLTFELAGIDSGFVDSSNRCVYLTSVSFCSDDATPLQYTLTYSANGGSYAPTAMSKSVDSSGYVTFTVTSLSAMYAGYTFQGWATSPTGSVVYEAGDTIKTNKNVTLYAVWKQNTYQLTYDDNGADSGAAPADGTAYTSGSTATVAGNTGNMALEGYVFAGWNTAADGTGTTYAPGASLTITGAVTLYAVWVLDEQVYIYTGTAWSKGEPEIFNGTAWQSGELALYANNNWNS